MHASEKESCLSWDQILRQGGFLLTGRKLYLTSAWEDIDDCWTWEKGRDNHNSRVKL